MKQTLKTKALSLRARAYSLREISESLKISKSSASIWTKGVPLDKIAKMRLDNISVLVREKAIITKKRKK